MHSDPRFLHSPNVCVSGAGSLGSFIFFISILVYILEIPQVGGSGPGSLPVQDATKIPWGAVAQPRDPRKMASDEKYAKGRGLFV